MFAGPVIIATLYFSLSRWPLSWFTTSTDYIAVLISLLVGLVGIKLKPWNIKTKTITSLIYVPVVIVGISFYGLVLICALFNSCL